ncbi:MAG: hypothetical protein ABGY96_10550 [bacterium]|nr:hypothetical protein [Gammaproteobacteria bacterium]HIL95608.1 hypothetical protein [Pseudomonadales bacterium]
MKTNAVIVSLLLVVIGIWGYYQRFYPVQGHGSWVLQVVHENLEGVSAFVYIDEDLYLVQEWTGGKFNGKLMLIDAQGSRTVLLENLKKPDGMSVYHGRPIFSQESGVHSLTRILEENIPFSLTQKFRNAEQIDVVQESGVEVIYVVEDLASGRLLKYFPQEERVETLLTGLQESEGVAVCADGSVLIAVKGTGEIHRVKPDGTHQVLLSGLNKPAGVSCSGDEFLIVEDTSHGNLYRGTLDNPEPLEIIASHLRSAQSILKISPGHIMVSEQGRARIIEFREKASGP